MEVLLHGYSPDCHFRHRLGEPATAPSTLSLKLSDHYWQYINTTIR